MELTINEKLYLIEQELNRRDRDCFIQSIKGLSDQELIKLKGDVIKRIEAPWRDNKNDI